MKPTTLTRGSIVYHRRYGKGTVLDEWGSWFSCRGCHLELKLNQLTKTTLMGKNYVTGQCAECAARTLYSPDPDSIFPLQVSGQGVYDVLFADGKTRPINVHWLILSEDSTPAKSE